MSFLPSLFSDPLFAVPAGMVAAGACAYVADKGDAIIRRVRTARMQRQFADTARRFNMRPRATLDAARLDRAISTAMLAVQDAKRRGVPHVYHSRMVQLLNAARGMLRAGRVEMARAAVVEALAESKRALLVSELSR